MKYIAWLFFGFVVLSCLEIATFATLGAKIGIFPTLAIIVLTGMAGACLAKKEGSKSWSNIKAAMHGGMDPSRELVNGICILLAGLALCMPGFITDCMGLAILIPQMRKLLVDFISRHWSLSSVVASTVNAGTCNENEDAATPSNGDYIDVEVTENKEDGK